MSILNIFTRKNETGLSTMQRNNNYPQRVSDKANNRQNDIYEDMHIIVINGLQGFASCESKANLKWDPMRAKYEMIRFNDEFNLACSMETGKGGSIEFGSRQKILPLKNRETTFVKHYLPSEHYYDSSLQEIKSKLPVRVIGEIRLHERYDSEKGILRLWVPYTENFVSIKVEDGLPMKILEMNDPDHIFGAIFYTVEYMEFPDGRDNHYRIYKPGPSYLAQFFKAPDLRDEGSWRKIEEQKKESYKWLGAECL